VQDPVVSEESSGWFEISKERAAEVLFNWADFMGKAEPYYSEGSLQTDGGRSYR
jgi:hypothetical protein